MIQEIVEQIENTARDVMNSSLHTAMPAEIVAIDEEKGLVDLKPAGSYYVNGMEMEYPIVPGVPLVTAASENASVVSPVKVGDSVMMVCAEQSVSSWLTGTTEDQMDERFELQNAMAIPGLQKQALEDQKEANADDAVIIRSGEARIKITDGKIVIKSGCTVIIEDNFVAITGKTVINGDISVTGNLHVSGDISCGGNYPGRQT